jgi:S1-C subfamily serine protease
VEPGSSADEAGVRRGDIVIKTNGIETLTTDKINEIKNQLQPGDELVLTVVRDGETLELTLVLKEDVPAEVKPATYRSGSGIEEET